MSRRKAYDKDITEMYGTATPSLLFTTSPDLRTVSASGSSYGYYPVPLSIYEPASLLLNFGDSLYLLQSWVIAEAERVEAAMYLDFSDNRYAVNTG